MADEKKGSLNIALALDFSLFKSKLTAMYYKEKNGYRFLAVPTNQGEVPEVSLDELMEDIQKMTGGSSTDEIQNMLEKAAEDAAEGGQESPENGKDQKIDVKNIRFSLKMVYLYIDTTKGDDNKIVEYAFNVNIVTTGLIPSGLKEFVTVDHLGIAVWNTDRKAILEQMSLVDMDSYLGLEDAKKGGE